MERLTWKFCVQHEFVISHARLNRLMRSIKKAHGNSGDAENEAGIHIALEKPPWEVHRGESMPASYCRDI